MTHEEKVALRQEVDRLEHEVDDHGTTHMKTITLSVNGEQYLMWQQTKLIHACAKAADPLSETQLETTLFSTALAWLQQETEQWMHAYLEGAQQPEPLQEMLDDLIPSPTLRRMEKRALELCQARGIAVQKRLDPECGEYNAYPDFICAQVFEEFGYKKQA